MEEEMKEVRAVNEIDFIGITNELIGMDIDRFGSFVNFEICEFKDNGISVVTKYYIEHGMCSKKVISFSNLDRENLVKIEETIDCQARGYSISANGLDMYAYNERLNGIRGLNNSKVREATEDSKKIAVGVKEEILNGGNPGKAYIIDSARVFRDIMTKIEEDEIKKEECEL
ncbi:MAG: hypothetical protein N4A47_04110 [Clostridia bacterium]|jgi:hypothetical protein|nr:hypothetical protein [Clostridia bacterium]